MSEQPGATPPVPAAGAGAPNGAAPNASKAAAAAAEGNPVFRMMGTSSLVACRQRAHRAAPILLASIAPSLRQNCTNSDSGLPNIKAKLPSRNWMIFLSLTGSFAAAVYYDKYQKRRIQRKWCDLVAPIAQETLPTTTLPRKVTVYIQSPPADGMRAAREHFHEYIKPVLVAAAMDWDVVEGRREGDLRWGTAERIRKQRRRAGEGAPEEGDDDVLLEIRERSGTNEVEGPKGDIVIGRHAWKEYVRGLHEGWLGPAEKPKEEVVEQVKEVSKHHADGVSSLGDMPVQAATNLVTPTSGATESDSEFASDKPAVFDDASPTASTPAEEEKPKEEPKEEEAPKPKNTKPDPYISTSAYSTASPSPSLPNELGPVNVIPFPHILGFWNFPIRIWRFLHRRELADDVGRQTAAAVLANYRPFNEGAGQDGAQSPGWEQEGILELDEPEWHKSVRKRERKDGEESVWLDPMVIDERIGQRMRRFEITAEDEAKAEKLFNEPPKEEVKEE